MVVFGSFFELLRRYARSWLRMPTLCSIRASIFDRIVDRCPTTSMVCSIVAFGSLCCQKLVRRYAERRGAFSTESWTGAQLLGRYARLWLRIPTLCSLPGCLLAASGGSLAALWSSLRRFWPCSRRESSIPSVVAFGSFFPKASSTVCSMEA